jgi:epoxide hydrolase-like predicted phosphatase
MNKATPNKLFDYAKLLKKSGLKLYILSNQMKFRADYIKTHFDIRFFNKAFFSNELGFMKPDKKIYNYVLKQIKFKPNECLFIDDKIDNIESAKSLGINTIQFKSVNQVKKDLDKFGVKI